MTDASRSNRYRMTESAVINSGVPGRCRTPWMKDARGTGPVRSPVEMREGHSRQGLSPRDSWSLTGASRGTRKRGTSANRLRRLGARSRRRVRSSASPVAASTFPPSGLCRSPATRKSHEKSRKNCLPGTDHELYASSESLFPGPWVRQVFRDLS